MLTTATMKRRPKLPGEMRLEEFLRPAGITQVELAARMGVPIQRVNGVVSGRRAVTAETAILVSRALRTTAALRLNLQMAVGRRSLGRRAQARARPSRQAPRRAGVCLAKSRSVRLWGAQKRTGRVLGRRRGLPHATRVPWEHGGQRAEGARRPSADAGGGVVSMSFGAGRGYAAWRQA